MANGTEPSTPGVGERSEQLTTELAEVLKMEKELAVCVDEAEACRKTEIIINKLMAHLQERGDFRKFKTADGEITIYDYDKVDEFQDELDKIGLDDIQMEAVDETEAATNLTVGDGNMSTVYEGSLEVALLHKEKYALAQRRIKLYNLMVKVRRWVGADIPWNEDLTNRDLTPKKLDERFDADG